MTYRKNQGPQPSKFNVVQLDRGGEIIKINTYQDAPPPTKRSNPQDVAPTKYNPGGRIGAKLAGQPVIAGPAFGPAGPEEGDDKPEAQMGNGNKMPKGGSVPGGVQMQGGIESPTRSPAGLPTVGSPASKDVRKQAGGGQLQIGTQTGKEAFEK